jgi:hypothetical protein
MHARDAAGGDGGSATSADGRKRGAHEGLDASGVLTHGTEGQREVAEAAQRRAAAGGERGGGGSGLSEEEEVLRARNRAEVRR